jgi:hypothetical protein
MTPKRFLEDSVNATEEVRLLRSAQRVAPPPKLRDEAWRAIAAQIAVGVAVSTTTSAVAAKATTLSTASASSSGFVSKSILVLALKSVAIGATAGGAVVVGHTAINSAQQTFKPHHVKAPAAQHYSLSIPQTNAVTTPSTSTPAIQSVDSRLESIPPIAKKTPGHGPHRSPSNSEAVRIEAKTIADVRMDLKLGNGPSALELLKNLERQVPHGMMQEERDALKIEALYRIGQRGTAERLVTEFRRRYPESPFFSSER